MDFIDSKYIGLVSSRLQKFKRVKADLYNFRCPYCGDSQRYKNKARGYIYKLKNDHNYKCHNCGVSRSFTNFLKDMDNVLYDQYVMERYKNGLTGKGSNTPDPTFNFQEPKFFKKPENSQTVKKVDLPSIAELNKEHFARQYVEQRKIPQKYLDQLYFCDNFKEWTNQQKETFESTKHDEPRIIIPLIKNGNLFGFQGRSLIKNSPIKYITVILNDKYPKVYGSDEIDWDKKVYVVEGPFDSMFVDNSIAMVGADIDYMFFLSNYDVDFVMVYDNEKRNKQIVQRIEKAIDQHFPVVIWPSNVKEKDINDMVLAGLEVQKVLESNTYSGLEAKTKLISWKRV